MSFYPGTPKYSWSDVSSSLGKLASNTGQFIKNVFSPQTTFKPNSFGVPIPQFHQIKTGDTFDSITKQYNLPPNSLQTTNKQVVPPPKGHWISLPQPQYLGQGVYTSTASPVAYQGNPGYAPITAQPGTTHPLYTAEIQKMAVSINQQLQNAALNGGPLPTNIPAPVAGTLINPQTGQPFTQQDFLDTGYVLDPVKGYVLKGTGNGPAAAAPGSNVSTRTVDAFGNPWNANTAKTDIYGGQFIQVGEVRWERSAATNGKLRRVQYLGGGRKKVLGGGEKVVEAPPAEATNTATTPTQQLSNILGGG